MKIDLTLKSGKVITLTPAELIELIDFKKNDDVVATEKTQEIEKPAPVWGSGLGAKDTTTSWDSIPMGSGWVPATEPKPAKPAPKPKVDWLQLIRDHAPTVSG